MDREAGGSGKGNIKEEKRGEYPEMVFTFWSAVAVLMISLEKTLGIPVKKYNENQKHFELETLPMKEYQENESLKNLLQGKITTVELVLIKELEKLFEEWKLYMDNLP